MNNVYFGLNNVAEKPSKIYVGDSNGVARKVKKAYLGVNGVAKQVYSEYVEPIDDNDWNYTLDGNNIILNYYKGQVEDADVVIRSSYTVNGVVYQTKISNSPDNANRAYMFNNYSGGRTFKVPKTITFERGIDTSECISMSYMFRDCYAEIYGLEYFDTSNTEQLQHMFYGVKKVEGIENWDTSKVRSFYCLFMDVAQEVFDLTGWNTSNVLNTYMMFNVCYNVKHIYVGDGWDMTKVTNSSFMFQGCSQLPNFNSSYIDKTKAYVGSDGYLENKS